MKIACIMPDDTISREYLRNVQNKNNSLILPVFSVTYEKAKLKKDLVVIFSIKYNVPKFFWFGLILIGGGWLLDLFGLVLAGVIVFSSGFFFSPPFVAWGIRSGYKKMTKRKLEVYY